MVDVMLVLLIIFMVITPMLSKGVSVDLVRTRQPDRDGRGRQRGRDPRGGHARRPAPSWGRSAYPRKRNWWRRSSDLVTNRIDKTVYLKCDGSARSYERVVESGEHLCVSTGVDPGRFVDREGRSRARSAARR